MSTTAPPRRLAFAEMSLESRRRLTELRDRINSLQLEADALCQGPPLDPGTTAVQDGVVVTRFVDGEWVEHVYHVAHDLRLETVQHPESGSATLVYREVYQSEDEFGPDVIEDVKIYVDRADVEPLMDALALFAAHHDALDQPEEIF